MRAARVALLALIAVVAAPAAAHADDDDPALRIMDFAERKGQLVVTARFTELFDRAAYEALGSGFPGLITLRAAVYRVGHEEPIAVSVATFHVVYDLWEQVYAVRIVDGRGQRNYRLERRADALKAVTEVAEFPLVDLDYVPIGPHFRCAMLIELNPVSEERLAEMRRWLTRPAGSARLQSNSSFFGSFVSVFVNPPIGSADRVLRLWSQPFYRVPRADARRRSP